MSEFIYQEPFPIECDKTQYRLLTKEYVKIVECDGRRILKVDPKGIELLAREAYTDVSFYLRPAHLEQLRHILEDPEASDNDKFVAYTMLLNQTVAAEGELPTCQDTGTVNGRTCSCVHKVMQQLRRQEIEQLSSLSISSFDTMELRYYPNTMDAQNGVNVRAYMGRLLDGLKQYAEDFSPTENESLMLIGNAGLGKTHAALAIAGLVLEQGHDVIYVSSPDFFGKIEASRFDPSGDADTLLRTASTADLLILDDLGTEFNSSFFLTNLYSLLNNRLGAKLPTIVTTNITDGALLEKLYTEKISSRLSAFVPCLFAGDDIRTQKAAE
jgi:DNA replication protein DnaC